MNKSKQALMKSLGMSNSTTSLDDAITSTEGNYSGAVQTAVENVEIRKNKNGVPYGMKVIASDGKVVDKPPKVKKDKGRLTASMNVFVKHLMDGKDKYTAYSLAYDTSKSTRASIIANANRLMRDDRITLLTQSIKDATQQNVVESETLARRYVMEELFIHANKSDASENGKLKALELMGKAVGMFTDKLETKTNEVDTDQLKKELESLIAK